MARQRKVPEQQSRAQCHNGPAIAFGIHWFCSGGRPGSLTERIGTACHHNAERTKLLRESMFQPCSRAHDSNYSWKTYSGQWASLASMLGEEIRKAETTRFTGLTQENLAFKAGVSRRYVSLLA